MYLSQCKKLFSQVAFSNSTWAFCGALTEIGKSNRSS